MSSFIRAVSSEWIKLRSTKSLYFNVALILLISVGLSALTGWGLHRSDPNAPGNLEFAFVGSVFAFVYLMVQAIMTFTTECRFGTLSTAFVATPQRIRVVLAKWVLVMVITLIVALAMVVGSYYVFNAYVDMSEFSLWSSAEGRRALWLYPVVAMLLATFAMGIAMLVRQTAGAVVVSIIWYLMLEDLIGAIPKIGEKVAPYLPMSNLRHFMTKTDIAGAPWGWENGIYYFIAFALAVFIIGLIYTDRRDA